MISRRYRYAVMLICAGLLGMQLLFLPAAGLQEDETLFVSPFLRDGVRFYDWHLGGIRIPVMSMAYLGALKSWLYWPIFHLWTPGVWSIRFPVCILSVITLAVFADLARRVAGTRVAIAAALILATDAVFVLLGVFDMTVGLLFLGTVAFLNLLHRFLSSGRKTYLGAAFFVAGISIWYKAVFVFPLAAMALAFLPAYGAEVRRHLSVRNALLAMICMGAGAAPLIDFNLRNAGATLKASANLPNVPRKEKLLMFQRTLDGRALEHYMFRSTADEKLALSGAPLGDLAIQWYRTSHFRPGSGLLIALAPALLALPFLRESRLFRPLLFSWIASTTLFGLMFLFPDAGSGPHHTVLIDPAPQFIVAATGAALMERWRGTRGAILTALFVLLIGSNLWLLAQYHRASRVNGFSVYWTDGVERLAEVVRAEGLPGVLLDWGIHNPIQIAAGNRLILDEDPTPRENVMYIAHCDGYRIDESRWKRYWELISASSLHVSESRVVTDTQGRPVFCLFRLDGGHS